MPREALMTKSGERITWNEAVARALKGIGHPVRAKEIKDYLPEHVIVEYPKTAKTPLYTIYRELYTHSRDSAAGKRTRKEECRYYSTEKGVWGLENEKLWRKHRSDKKCDPKILDILGQKEFTDENELQDYCDQLRQKAKEWELLFGEAMLLIAVDTRNRTLPNYFSHMRDCSKQRLFSESWGL
ncbi:MAG: hypothetical protein LUI87_19890 [Lachnospiraceae bacterium]|nr:hypothetical protein [Lachnospiraceae bacterium]